MNTPQRAAPSALPSPDAAAAEHSAALTAHVARAIDEAGGWLPFSRYMELALYAPGLGYYSAGAQKFGEGGDFVTAPELTPLFGQCLATQVGEVLDALGGGDLVEFGPGSGRLAADLLLALEALYALPQRVLLVEISAELRARQRATLTQRCPQLLKRVRWLNGPPDADVRGVVLGNEVLDALPVECFEIDGDAVLARGVAWHAGRPVWRSRPADAALVAAVRAVEETLGRRLPHGYRGEVRPGVGAWLATVTARLAAGSALFIDYGLAADELYLPERRDGTLACHYRHRFHTDPFHLPGLTDITAWVDFTAVADAAVAAGLTVAGYATQAHFLLGCQLDVHAQRAMQAAPTPAAQLAVANAVKQLTLPGEMGERFKVLGLTRNLAQPLAGFAVRQLGL